ncbi:MAG: ABC transporter ATP-binding protein [Clostridia bacterium]|nr:ABC transporter ATP-binding protein [Clostridia bacterium]
MLNIENLSFSYDQKPVFTGLNLTLSPGERIALMGPSGCGKSTLLQLIAGLLSAKEGTLQKGYSKLSYVFQEPRLFPWLTVKQNLEAVLTSKEDATERIAEALRLVRLSDSADLYPEELSGGMKIRASLARALVNQGDLFLLDEPFASLDLELREEISIALRKELGRRGSSAILVTHHLEDAKRFADRIVLFDDLKK